MNKNEVCEMLYKLEIPFVYSHFKEGSAPRLPFLIYYYDGVILHGLLQQYLPERDILHEEVSSKDFDKIIEGIEKDFKLEKKIEDLLQTYSLIYTKDEVWIPSEEMYETIYKMEV